MKNIDTVSINFMGDDEILLDTLSESLKATLKTLNLIANKTIVEDEFCKIVVKDIKRGSFIIDIATIIETAENIFEHTPEIVSTFWGILEIRKHLNGKKPREIKKIDNNQVAITNDDGVTTNVVQSVFTVYRDDYDIEKELAKLAKAVADDPGRDGISINTQSSEENNSIDFDKETLRELSRPFDQATLWDEVYEDDMTVILGIHSPDFIGNKQWTFEHPTDGTISAKILDEEFIYRVRNENLPLTADTKLKVLLHYSVPMIDGNYISSQVKYTVIKIMEIIYPDNVDFEQTSIYSNDK